jgi:hypothetical protein
MNDAIKDKIKVNNNYEVGHYTSILDKSTQIAKG